MSDLLSSYGYTFQVKVITALLRNRTFLQQVYDILDPKYFESEANQWLIEQIIDYGKVYKSSPTLEVLKYKIQEIEHDVLKQEVIQHLKDAWRYVESEDLTFIEEKVLDFCKNQQIKKAIISSVELLKQGKYDQIKFLVDNALKAGADKVIGHDYVTNIEDRYTQAVRFVKETPWEVINELTDGGLGKGELGVFVAPAGIGKSWGLINIGAHALKKGQTVLHYTLELNEAYVGLRYDSVVTGIANQNLKHHLEDVKQAVEKLPGNLIIKYYPTKSCSVTGLRGHIEKCILQGKKPDIIVVDYADLLKGNGAEKRHELESIYEDLRGLAGEYDVPVWTASQANRCHVLTDSVETPYGKLEIGKIKKGDKVLTHAGFREVTHVFPVEKQAVYKVRLKSGKEITISANHELPTLYGVCKSLSTGLSVGDKVFTKKKNENG